MIGTAALPRTSETLRRLGSTYLRLRTSSEDTGATVLEVEADMVDGVRDVIKQNDHLSRRSGRGLLLFFLVDVCSFQNGIAFFKAMRTTTFKTLLLLQPPCVPRYVS